MLVKKGQQQLRDSGLQQNCGTPSTPFTIRMCWQRMEICNSFEMGMWLCLCIYRKWRHMVTNKRFDQRRPPTSWDLNVFTWQLNLFGYPILMLQKCTYGVMFIFRAKVQLIMKIKQAARWFSLTGCLRYCFLKTLYPSQLHRDWTEKDTASFPALGQYRNFLRVPKRCFTSPDSKKYS